MRIFKLLDLRKKSSEIQKKIDSQIRNNRNQSVGSKRFGLGFSQKKNPNSRVPSFHVYFEWPNLFNLNEKIKFILETNKDFKFSMEKPLFWQTNHLLLSSNIFSFRDQSINTILKKNGIEFGMRFNSRMYDNTRTNTKVSPSLFQKIKEHFFSQKEVPKIKPINRFCQQMLSNIKLAKITSMHISTLNYISEKRESLFDSNIQLILPKSKMVFGYIQTSSNSVVYNKIDLNPLMFLKYFLTNKIYLLSEIRLGTVFMTENVNFLNPKRGLLVPGYKKDSIYSTEDGLSYIESNMKLGFPGLRLFDYRFELFLQHSASLVDNSRDFIDISRSFLKSNAVLPISENFGTSYSVGGIFPLRDKLPKLQIRFVYKPVEQEKKFDIGFKI